MSAVVGVVNPPTTQIIAVVRWKATTTPEQLAPGTQAEVRAAWDLYRKGTIREMFRLTHDTQLDARRPGNVLVLDCRSIEDAHATMQLLPFVSAGLVEYDLIPVGAFSPLERLFAPWRNSHAGEPE